MLTQHCADLSGKPFKLFSTRSLASKTIYFFCPQKLFLMQILPEKAFVTFLGNEPNQSFNNEEELIRSIAISVVSFPFIQKHVFKFRNCSQLPKLNAQTPLFDIARPGSALSATNCTPQMLLHLNPYKHCIWWNCNQSEREAATCAGLTKLITKRELQFGKKKPLFWHGNERNNPFP